MILPFEDLARECCDPLGVDIGTIQGDSRRATVSLARQLYMTLLMESKGFSSPEAASAAGRTYHGTALYARKQVMSRIYTPWKQRIIDDLIGKYVKGDLAETAPIQQD